MRVAIIGRTEILYNSAIRLDAEGHQIVCIVTSKEAPEYTRTSADFHSLAKNWQIPFAQGSRISDFIDLLKAANADIAVSMNYTGILPQSVIDLFPLGVLNAHGGDLPRYRGNACQAWAILNGENRIGLCIHKMIGDELDSGDIIEREYLSIDHNTKVTFAWEWLQQRIPILMLKSLEMLSINSEYFLERQSTDPKDALRCYPRNPDDGRIEWCQSSLKILRLINASNKPYAGAYCYLNEKKLIIWDAALSNTSQNYCAVPGQIVRFNQNSIVVACQAGELEIFQVECNEYVGNPRTLVTSIRQRLS